jgi:hypothetical protein
LISQSRGLGDVYKRQTDTFALLAGLCVAVTAGVVPPHAHYGGWGWNTTQR